MQLNLKRYIVHKISWGERTKYSNGQLTVCRAELIDFLQNHSAISDLKITALHLVAPQSRVRVVNIFDVFAARARLGQNATDYPGVLGPVQSVGHGTTAALDNFTVLVTSNHKKRYVSVLDMSGPLSLLTPYSQFFHLVVCAEPKNVSMPDNEFNYKLKLLGLITGVYLAKKASVSSPSDIKIYRLDDQPHLPKVVYVCMIKSHQKTDDMEPVLYGYNTAGLVPTVLHPNEFLDGAVICPFGSVGMDSYSFQNNPVITELYNRHGRDLNFAGVIIYTAEMDRKSRQRSVVMVSQLAKEILKADLAIVSKVGGGVAESDMMLIMEALENRGVLTSGIIWSNYGDGTLKDSLTFNSSSVDALVSVGIHDEVLELNESLDTIGGKSPKQILYRDLLGAISQLGASRIAQEEY